MRTCGLTHLLACGGYPLIEDPTGERARILLEKMVQTQAPTAGSLLFEVVVLLGVAAVCALLYRRVTNFPLKFLATAAGVLIFEFFTAPMWHNEKLGFWGYVYHDVSWILTLGWSALILATMTLVNTWLPRRGELARFVVSLVLLLVLVLFAENVVLALGIRHYAPEVQAVFCGYRIGLAPIEGLYYIPVFAALVVAFSRYWSYFIDNAALVPVKRRHWLRALGLTALAVVLFEVMIEPMVENRNLPSWSYFYRDLSFLLTGTWVLLIAVVGIVVQRFLSSRPLPQRFAAALLLLATLAVPLESWLILNGYRVYGPSAVENFCGIKTWLTGVPVEIAFAIPMYMALIIGFVRYWEIVADNNL